MAWLAPCVQGIDLGVDFQLYYSSASTTWPCTSGVHGVELG